MSELIRRLEILNKANIRRREIYLEQREQQIEQEEQMPAEIEQILANPNSEMYLKVALKVMAKLRQKLEKPRTYLDEQKFTYCKDIIFMLKDSLDGRFPTKWNKVPSWSQRDIETKDEFLRAVSPVIPVVEDALKRESINSCQTSEIIAICAEQIPVDYNISK